jgi:hypothetical protein
MNTCALLAENGDPCGGLVAEGAPFPLCTGHLLAVHDWVAGEVGVSDVLPSPCLACGSRLGVRYPSGWLCAVCEWRLGDTVDPEIVAAVRVDVVYYLRFRDRIKIGTSANPRQRLATLRHDELLAFELGDRSLEQRRHSQFAEQRLDRTEWFRMGDPLMAHIELLRAGVLDPWARYALWRSQRLALLG